MKKIVFFLSIFYSLLGKSQIIRNYSNEFMNIGNGARGLAMGNAVVASQMDIYSQTHNPAGLTSISSDWQGAVMHSEYFESIAKYDYVGYAKSIDTNSSFAISVIRFGVDNILDTTKMIDNEGNIDYDRISKFSQADYAGIISYGFHPSGNHKLSLGLNTKLIYRNVGKLANAFGFGFDVGAIYQDDRDWRFGAMLKDATTTMNFWSINQSKLSTIVNGEELNPIPKEKIELTMPTLNLGVSRTFEINRDLNFTPEVDLHIDFTRTNTLVSTDVLSFSPSLGAELSWQDIIFVRAGVSEFQNITNPFHQQNKVSFQPSAGIGIKYKGLSLDYDISNSGIGGSNLYSNFFSLKLDMSGFR